MNKRNALYVVDAPPKKAELEDARSTCRASWRS